MKPLCDLLVVSDTKIVMVILDAISNILEASQRTNNLEQVCVLVEESEGLDKIEALQQHENQEVYRLALSIIEKYFTEEVSANCWEGEHSRSVLSHSQNDEDQTLAPSTSSGQFQFAPAPQQVGGFSFS